MQSSWGKENENRLRLIVPTMDTLRGFSATAISGYSGWGYLAQKNANATRRLGIHGAGGEQPSSTATA